jgi:hypothetical protein
MKIMKHAIKKTSVSLSIYLLMIVFGGIGVYAEEKKCEDVSGTWSTTVEIDNSNCGFPNQTISFTYEMIQNGCVLTVKGRGHNAVVKGDRIHWPGGTIPGRLAGSTVTLEEGVSQVSGNKATGKRSWTWTDGTKTCTGTNIWTDVRLPHRDAGCRTVMLNRPQLIEIGSRRTSCSGTNTKGMVRFKTIILCRLKTQNLLYTRFPARWPLHQARCLTAASGQVSAKALVRFPNLKSVSSPIKITSYR